MTAAQLHFLPWLRVGAAAAAGAADPLSGPLPAGGAVRPWVQIAGRGDPVAQDARVLGPGHVTGLGPVVTRTVPAPDTPDAEPNYLAFAELTPPDLPWRFTPARAGADAQLRPWLVLVVVRRQEGVTLGPLPGALLPVLTIEAPASPAAELPDLSDSAAWAHVQSSLTAVQLATSLASDPAAALARLVCPRHLQADASWWACLVPAFDLGVRAGLGDADAAAGSAAPAWAPGDDGPVRLPVFFSWTFSTGPGGDFESLARRLAPDEGETELGRVGLDIASPGPPLPAVPARARDVGDLVGGLRTPGVRRRDLPDATARWYEEHLTELLDAGVNPSSVPAGPQPGYDPLADDPVVSVPFHGATQAAATAVPPTPGPDGWLRELNLDPQLRAIAGIGAAIVRDEQEALVASAWAQAGALQETVQALDFARLAVDAGRSLARRVSALEPGWTAQLTRQMHPWATSPASAGTLASDVWRTLPHGLLGAPLQRVTRASRSVGRGWTRLVPDSGPAPASATSSFLEATRTGATVLAYAQVRAPLVAWPHDALLDQPASAFTPTTARSRATRISTPRPDLDTDIDPSHLPHVPAGLDLSGTASAAVAALDPLPAVRDRVLSRIPAAAALGTIALDLAPPVLHPVFPDPLSADVIRLDPRLLLPGAERLATNRVTVVVGDDDYVASVLVGANTELARELLWREYPTALTATFFHRFWDTGVSGPDDIGDIGDWHRARPGGHVTGIGASDLAVVVVRGDVVRRYPAMHVYAVRAVWDGATAVPDETDTREPVMLGTLDRETRFYGIPVSATDLRGDRAARPRTAASAGWFLALEEPSAGPRFGLDEPDGSDATTGPATWDDLTWGHLARAGQTADDVAFAVARRALPARTGATPAGPVWGHNAAHMAAITYQRPFRLLLHADLLLPAS